MTTFVILVAMILIVIDIYLFFETRDYFVSMSKSEQYVFLLPLGSIYMFCVIYKENISIVERMEKKCKNN